MKRVEKTIYEVEIHSDKEKVPDAVFSKEGHADSVLRHERTHQYWFLWKMCSSKYCFLLSSPQAKFTIYWMIHIYGMHHNNISTMKVVVLVNGIQKWMQTRQNYYSLVNCKLLSK